MKACHLLSGTLVFLLAISAGAESLESADEIQSCVSKNQTHASSRGTIELIAVDRIGAASEKRATIHWKLIDGNSNVHVEFSAPAEIRGSALLMVQKSGRNDMFMYLPELKRSRRVTGRMVTGSIFGTDFSYEQLERVMGMAEDTSATRSKDSEEQGRPVFVLESTPDPEESQFVKIVSFVDKQTCAPLKIDFYEKGERIRKVLTVDPSKVEKRGESWIPMEMLMTDLRDETHTTLVVQDIQMNVEIPRKMFSMRNLDRGR